MKKYLGKFVEVLWQDAVSTASWVSPKELVQEVPSLCRNRGWLVRVTKDHIVLASSLSYRPGDPTEVRDFGEVISIPGAWVKRIGTRMQKVELDEVGLGALSNE